MLIFEAANWVKLRTNSPCNFTRSTQNPNKSHPSLPQVDFEPIKELNPNFTINFQPSITEELSEPNLFWTVETNYSNGFANIWPNMILNTNFFLLLKTLAMFWQYSVEIWLSDSNLHPLHFIFIPCNIDYIIFSTVYWD